MHYSYSMGKPFYINDDGSATQSSKRYINNIEWLDYKQYKGKRSAIQVIACVICLFPIYGWGVGLLSCCGIRIARGYWPFFGIQAIENTNSRIKVFCDKKGLGLYAKKRRTTSAKYVSVQQLPTVDYPAFVLEYNGKYCPYNFIQGKTLFHDLDKITYLGDNTVHVEKMGKVAKHSLIGMCIE